MLKILMYLDLWQLKMNPCVLNAYSKFLKLLAKQGRLRSDCFWRSSLIRVLSVCYFDKHFVNSSPENQQFIWAQNLEKSVWNFWIYAVYELVCSLNVGPKYSKYLPVCPFSLQTNVPSCALKTRTLWSSDPVTMISKSGENATELTCQRKES